MASKKQPTATSITPPTENESKTNTSQSKPNSTLPQTTSKTTSQSSSESTQSSTIQATPTPLIESPLAQPATSPTEKTIPTSQQTIDTNTNIKNQYKILLKDSKNYNLKGCRLT